MSGCQLCSDDCGCPPATCQCTDCGMELCNWCHDHHDCALDDGGDHDFLDDGPEAPKV